MSKSQYKQIWNQVHDLFVTLIVYLILFGAAVYAYAQIAHISASSIYYKFYTNKTICILTDDIHSSVVQNAVTMLNNIIAINVPIIVCNINDKQKCSDPSIILMNEDENIISSLPLTMTPISTDIVYILGHEQLAYNKRFVRLIDHGKQYIIGTPETSKYTVVAHDLIISMANRYSVNK